MASCQFCNFKHSVVVGQFRTFEHLWGAVWPDSSLNLECDFHLRGLATNRFQMCLFLSDTRFLTTKASARYTIKFACDTVERVLGRYWQHACFSTMSILFSLEFRSIRQHSELCESSFVSMEQFVDQLMCSIVLDELIPKPCNLRMKWLKDIRTTCIVVFII